jgi:hypothetical protein
MDEMHQHIREIHKAVIYLSSQNPSDLKRETGQCVKVDDGLSPPYLLPIDMCSTRTVTDSTDLHLYFFHSPKC